MAWWAANSSSGDSVSSRKRGSKRDRRKNGDRLRDRKDYELYYGGKGRKPRIWFIQHSMRFMAALMFVFLLLYEVLVLKGNSGDGLQDLEAPQKDTTKYLSNYSGGSSVTKPSMSEKTTFREQSEGRDKGVIHAPHRESGFQQDAITRAQYADQNTNFRKATNGESVDHHPESREHGMNLKRTSLDSGVSESRREDDQSGHTTREENTQHHSLESSKEEYEDLQLRQQSSIAAESGSNRLGHTSWRTRRKRRRQRQRAEAERMSESRHEGNRSSDEDNESGDSQSREKSYGREEHGTKPGSEKNFWTWFQDSKKTEGKGASAVACPEDHKRLCQMFYKVVKKYKVRKVFDISCAKNLEWMPTVLSNIGNEMWGFQYHCSDPEGENVERAKEVLQEFKFVEYHNRQWWKAGFPNNLDMVFAWDVLPHTAYGRVWSFFVHVRKQNIKYVLFDNYPGILNDPSPKRYYVNVRKHPFKFPAAKDVIQNVTEPGENAKRQLLFYASDMLPEQLGA